jgi:hypothetical protein
VKDRWEVTAQLPSEAFIQCVCAFTYMNASSRRNLSDAPTTEMNGARNGPDKGSALGGVTGMARSRRMVVTCMWGVSDPLRAARGAKKGAAKWGSLTPHCLRRREGGCSGCATGGTDRRPLTFVEVADCQRPVTLSRPVAIVASPAASNVTCVQPRGTVLPSFGSPTLFPSRAAHDSSQWGQNLVTIDL